MQVSTANPTPPISIAYLNLRVPGQNKATGQRIATRASELLAGHDAKLPAQRIGALNLRLSTASGASEEGIAQEICNAILRNLSHNPHA